MVKRCPHVGDDISIDSGEDSEDTYDLLLKLPKCDPGLNLPSASRSTCQQRNNNPDPIATPNKVKVADSSAKKTKKIGRIELRPKAGNQVAPLAHRHSSFDGKRFDKNLNRARRRGNKVCLPQKNMDHRTSPDSDDDAAVHDQREHLKLVQKYANIEKYGHQLKSEDDEN